MSTVGPLLSEYRKRYHLSQLDLSLLADVSSRHISFIETGKTKPSRTMLLRLADVMDLPLKDSNLLLHSGGYAAAYTQLEFNSEEMAPVRQALNIMLENHHPYPALVMDGSWNVLMVNRAQEAMNEKLLPQMPAAFSGNLLEAVFREDLYKPFIGNWDQVASHTLRRLRKQVVAYAKQEHQSLYDRLLELAPPDNWQQPDEGEHDGPMMTIDFKFNGLSLSMFSTLSQFGTALDIGMEELTIESYFPADEASRLLFEQLAASF